MFPRDRMLRNAPMGRSLEARPMARTWTAPGPPIGARCPRQPFLDDARLEAIGLQVRNITPTGCVTLSIDAPAETPTQDSARCLSRRRGRCLQRGPRFVRRHWRSTNVPKLSTGQQRERGHGLGQPLHPAFDHLLCLYLPPPNRTAVIGSLSPAGTPPQGASHLPGPWTRATTPVIAATGRPAHGSAMPNRRRLVSTLPSSSARWISAAARR